jgi:acyl-CoA ligase (AMP-forming) (exosortase A-associated)
MLRESARSYPDKHFLVQEGRRLSFNEVDAITERLGRAVAGAGTARGDRVGVFLDHSLDQVLSFFAISKAGGVYVPMNSLLKGHQVDHIARDCEVAGLIVDDKRLEELRGTLPDWPFLRFLVVLGERPGWLADLDLRVSSYTEIVEGGEVDPLPDLGIGADLAALLYTSGSTGRPKGVMITHDNLIVGARIVTTYVENRHDDRLLGVLPLSFDYGLNQVTSCALEGMTYVMKSFRFPGELVKVLLEERITGFAGIPTVWLLLLQTGSPVYKRTFDDLRYITNSGGVFPPHAIEKVRKVFPETRIVLMYGLTEAFRSTYLPPDQIDVRPTSMGKAIPGCEMMVVDKEGKLCPPGVEGELVHRGPTVALGYWNNPEKTAEVYRPNHFLPQHLQQSERLVFSGDLVKTDEEGYLYFVSREDHMIKCYGHRISPAEIEEVLYSSGKVKLGAAIGVPHPIRGQSIKVFVVPSPGVELDEEAVLGICAEKLPQFMMPQDVEICDELPRTGTGKIDLALLKKREQEQLQSGGAGGGSNK